MASDPIEVPYTSLGGDTLRSLIEEYVTRSGTDYGDREAALDRKVADVLRLLERGEARIVFDPETESCDIREGAAQMKNRHRALEPDAGV